MSHRPPPRRGRRATVGRGLVLALTVCVVLAGLTEAGGSSMTDADIEQAASLMTRFAERTGLTSEVPQQRYLWTDAFAVCNLLGLARATGEARYRELALRLVDRVHHTLGRHRADDPRTGWISGLGEEEGSEHPTRGGLRIGKELAERGPAEPYDPQLEWERDGQYFHYLTRWMHALDLAARDTGEERFNRWARELAETAHGAFTRRPAGGGPPRMVWKMSIDLSRPLVPSMGHHDPLDGYVTALQLQATGRELTGAAREPDLEDEIASFASMIEGRRDWATTDPLGLGGLLGDASRVDQLTRQGSFAGGELLENLLVASLDGLGRYGGLGELRRPAAARLAFRELGLAIGLAAAKRMLHHYADDPEPLSKHPTLARQLEALGRHLSLGAEVVSFWREPAHRETPTWKDHLDINEVMLATALAPEGCLVLPATEHRASSPKTNEGP